MTTSTNTISYREHHCDEAITMYMTPPVPCDFQVGDVVRYTNDNGVQFELTVKGFTEEVTSWGAFIYIFDDCYWYPAKPENCELIRRPLTAERASAIISEAQALATFGPWPDQLDKCMTKEERDAVNRKWATMPGTTTFVDALYRIARRQ